MDPEVARIIALWPQVRLALKDIDANQARAIVHGMMVSFETLAATLPAPSQVAPRSPQLERGDGQLDIGRTLELFR